MADSPEKKVQIVAKAILAAHATFAAVNIEHHVEDDSTVSKGNRITVKADKPTPKIIPRAPDVKASVWQTTLTVSLQTDAAETTFDTWQADVDAALNPSSAFSAGIITTATTNFPNGIVIENANGGAIFDGPGPRRTLTRTYPVVFGS